MRRFLIWMACSFSPLLALALLTPLACFAQDASEIIKVGVIGLDTSHVIDFTKCLNDPTTKDHIPGFRVVAGYKGGSPDMEASRTRVDKYTEELRERYHVEIVSDIPTLCHKVDVVLLESIDGRKHLEQVRPVFAAHKPVFIDKPLAGSYREAKEIADLGRQSGDPWFTASSLRFWSETERLKHPQGFGQVIAYDVQGPTIREPHLPTLFNYGVHAVEMLFQLMGPGCESVSMQSSGNQDVAIGKWKDGRLSIMRGFSSGLSAFSITAYGIKGVLHSENQPEGYSSLMIEITKFFKTHVAPVNPGESLEVIAFMQAAELSKNRGGAAVPLIEVTR